MKTARERAIQIVEKVVLLSSVGGVFWRVMRGRYYVEEIMFVVDFVKDAEMSGQIPCLMRSYNPDIGVIEDATELIKRDNWRREFVGIMTKSTIILQFWFFLALYLHIKLTNFC